MASHVVARAEEIPPGSRRIVEVAGRSIGVFNVDGTFHALRNRCPHQGGPLCEGQILAAIASPGPGRYDHRPGDAVIRCPWHAWEFDLRTGRSWFDPAKVRVRAYRADVRPGDELVAERYPVSVRDSYVVVEVGAG
jgi:nitrite reductase/ring-hydroxylating ferredoxin subunit